MDFEGSFLLGSGFLSDEMTTTATTASYEPIETKYDYSQHVDAQHQPASMLGTVDTINLVSPSSSSVSSQVQLSLHSPAFDFASTMVEGESDASTPSLSPPSVQPQTGNIRKPNQGGRKRSIIFEQEEAEIQRKEFLERNRIAASKCRQKKKKWMKDLETKYEKLSTQNQQLRSMVLLYQDEINSLKTELLSRNGLCSCADMRSYIQRNNTSMDSRKMLTQDYDLLTTLSKTPLAAPTPCTNETLPPLSLPPYLNEY